jgi:hypothetical protein
VEPTQPPIQWVPEVVSPLLKQQGREANHFPPSTAKIKNGGVLTPLPHTSLWLGAKYIKPRDKLYLLLLHFNTQK